MSKEQHPVLQHVLVVGTEVGRLVGELDGREETGETEGKTVLMEVGTAVGETEHSEIRP